MNVPYKLYFQPVSGKLVDENNPYAIAYVPESIVRQKDDVIHTLNKVIERLKNQINHQQMLSSRQHNDDVDNIPTRE
jgi:hypothetical protein